ncbi:MAG: ORF6N domain-containing protein [Bacilli bacterium]|nr:ORF6N domain-containing protein [Bacilli bacterium]
MDELEPKNKLLPLAETEEGIADRIFTIRGVQVMLDSDIASLFQVEVKMLNRQMKRNPDRFPMDFCFQLTEEEILRLQFAITMQTKGTKVVSP